MRCSVGKWVGGNDRGREGVSRGHKLKDVRRCDELMDPTVLGVLTGSVKCSR